MRKFAFITVAAVFHITASIPVVKKDYVTLNADLIMNNPALTGVDNVDWEAVREDIRHELHSGNHPGRATLAPLMVRLAWHSAGTYDPVNKPHGGSNGATMRYEPESGYEDNRGLDLAREVLESVKQKHPAASLSDIWVLAGYVGVEDMEGPHIDFKPGRIDASTGGPNHCPPENRLPFFNESAKGIRDKFERMGFSDRDLVALVGAHTVGHTHIENSGFPFHNWDLTPQKFDNSYFDFLLRDWWNLDDEDPDHPYYRNRSWLMLLSDFVLKEDPKFLEIVVEYSKDEASFHKDFASAFKRLTELGLEKEMGVNSVSNIAL
eukprot:m.307313 g.307313  ORF g.307313 m.307313 type:complete len:321 (-) comp16458_c1_seq4:3077-4039(-)